MKQALASKEHIEELSLPKLLLNVDFIPTDVGKAGPELIASQVGGYGRFNRVSGSTPQKKKNHRLTVDFKIISGFGFLLLENFRNFYPEKW